MTDSITPVGGNSAKAELPLQKFYDAELLEVPEQARKILETYSRIPEDEVLAHVLEVVSLL